MVGVILAGGNGSRLYPLTKCISKQLLPIYSVPMLYFPLTFLMKAGIKEFVIITNSHNVDNFKTVLSDGSQWGIEITVLPQEAPKGIAEAYLIAEPIVNGRNSILILGDNVFHGCSARDDVYNFEHNRKGANLYECKIFGYRVNDPQRYGVIEAKKNLDVVSIEEKPKKPKSNYAAVGLYICDGSAAERVKKQKQSKRGELEITDLMNSYLEEGVLKMSGLPHGTVWLDAGTKRSYVEAISFVEAVEERTGRMIACPEEIALQEGYISRKSLEEYTCTLPDCSHKEYIEKLLK